MELATPPVLSVSALTSSIRYQLEPHFRFVVVQGEVSNAKLQSSGHFYFSLKDSEAMVQAVMFRTEVAGLTRVPKEGDQIVVKGSVVVYPPSGRYQIVCRELNYLGVGELLLKLEQLKMKLHQLGWFKAERKKPLPHFPKTIGIITSPTGAAIQDILHVLTRRFGGFHAILNPVKVQGEGAAQEIATAIRFMNTHQLCDVLIVGRGGGSIEDLWAFNEEIVAQAIFESAIPVISAVGHETDHCIADYVADVRAPTPSAAAEMVIAEKGAQLKHLAQLVHRLTQAGDHLTDRWRLKLAGIRRHPLFASPYTLLGMRSQRLDELKLRLETLSPRNQFKTARQRLQLVEQSLHQRMDNLNKQREQRLRRIVDLLHALDPRSVLKKGYALVYEAQENRVITSVRSLAIQEQVRLVLSDGHALSTISEISHHE